MLRELTDSSGFRAPRLCLSRYRSLRTLSCSGIVLDLLETTAQSTSRLLILHSTQLRPCSLVVPRYDTRSRLVIVKPSSPGTGLAKYHSQSLISTTAGHSALQIFPWLQHLSVGNYRYSNYRFRAYTIRFELT